MSRASQVELEHCKELALFPGSLFEFTSQFIPSGRQQQLMALYALTQSIGSIPSAPVEDSVKWAKLKWWGDELLSEPDAPSRHPVLRALWQSGARELLANKLLFKLVNDAVMRIDVMPDADEKAFFDRLAARGETEILLELALDSVEVEAHDLAHLAAASAMFNMISGYCDQPRRATLHLPLNLLAKYQLKPSGLKQQPPAEELAIIISQLANNGADWFVQGLSGLDSTVPASKCVHLQLRWAMEARSLTRNSKRAGAYLRRGDRFGPSDAWFAWRFCRARSQ